MMTLMIMMMMITIMPPVRDWRGRGIYWLDEYYDDYDDDDDDDDDDFKRSGPRPKTVYILYTLYYILAGQNITDTLLFNLSSD